MLCYPITLVCVNAIYHNNMKRSVLNYYILYTYLQYIYNNNNTVMELKHFIKKTSTLLRKH